MICRLIIVTINWAWLLVWELLFPIRKWQLHFAVSVSKSTSPRVQNSLLDIESRHFCLLYPCLMISLYSAMELQQNDFLFHTPFSDAFSELVVIPKASSVTLLLTIWFRRKAYCSDSCFLFGLIILKIADFFFRGMIRIAQLTVAVCQNLIRDPQSLKIWKTDVVEHMVRNGNVMCILLALFLKMKLEYIHECRTPALGGRKEIWLFAKLPLVFEHTWILWIYLSIADQK